MKYWTKPWNAVVGCTKCSPACDSCYAERLHTQRHYAHKGFKRVPACYAKPFNEIQLLPDRLTDPLHWRKPQTVFVCNMSDLFHKDVPDEYIWQVFGVMALTPQHQYFVCTKRAERMEALIGRNPLWRGCSGPESSVAARAIRSIAPSEAQGHVAVGKCLSGPLPNVTLAVTVWDQESADKNIPLLLATPAARRVVSYEPALGPVDFGDYIKSAWMPSHIVKPHSVPVERMEVRGIDGIIAGGETGQNARPASIDWFRSARDQCAASGVAFMLKQLDAKGNRILDARTHDELAWEGK